ncbi:unnamed protein product [Clonostachys byssicola]|uniref:NmrA-like domain-containing protein n=1 Tax=Clonostachys byssicola TaxID=160290 RepID=A0A9N9U4T0_9HYPO|nr:unnamed protein product [Clonostachys byssicola]
MAIIAIAGGTGPVGKCIVDGLVQHGGYKVFVLSRRENLPASGVNYLLAQYADIEATAQALQQAKIDTLICAIGVRDEKASEAQTNLIRASHISSTTRRFIVSAYDKLQVPEHASLTPRVKYTLDALEELEKTDLSYTRVVNGLFLDYYGMPHWKTPLHPWLNAVNMEKKWAVIPGDGSAQADFITSQDLGTFIGRLMDLEHWDKVSSIVSNTMTMNKLVELAEKTRGCKFKVVHDSLDRLKSGKISFIEEFPPIGRGDGDQAYFALIHYQIGLGYYRVPNENTLNERLSDIVVTSAEEVMKRSWGGR